MPNILAHTYITTEIKGAGDPSLVLGSTLPDFAAMFKETKIDPDQYVPGRIKIRGHNDSTDNGIDFHQKTDDIFNSQPEKPKITTPLAANLTQVGLSEGAARLSSDFVAKLILDGVLLDRPDAREAFDSLSYDIAQGITALTHGFEEDFSNFVLDYFVHNAPSQYTEPDKIAEITHYRLDGRARSTLNRQKNTFSEHLIPAVAGVIDIHMERASALGLVALDRTIETLLKG